MPASTPRLQPGCFKKARSSLAQPVVRLDGYALTPGTKVSRIKAFANPKGVGNSPGI